MKFQPAICLLLLTQSTQTMIPTMPEDLTTVVEDMPVEQDLITVDKFISLPYFQTAFLALSGFSSQEIFLKSFGYLDFQFSPILGVLILGSGLLLLNTKHDENFQLFTLFLVVAYLIATCAYIPDLQICLPFIGLIFFLASIALYENNDIDLILYVLPSLLYIVCVAASYHFYTFTLFFNIIAYLSSAAYVVCCISYSLYLADNSINRTNFFLLLLVLFVKFAPNKILPLLLLIDIIDSSYNFYVGQKSARNVFFFCFNLFTIIPTTLLILNVPLVNPRISLYELVKFLQIHNFFLRTYLIKQSFEQNIDSFIFTSIDSFTFTSMIPLSFNLIEFCSSVKASGSIFGLIYLMLAAFNINEEKMENIKILAAFKYMYFLFLSYVFRDYTSESRLLIFFIVSLSGILNSLIIFVKCEKSLSSTLAFMIKIAFIGVAGVLIAKIYYPLSVSIGVLKSIMKYLALADLLVSWSYYTLVCSDPSAHKLYTPNITLVLIQLCLIIELGQDMLKFLFGETIGITLCVVIAAGIVGLNAYTPDVYTDDKKSHQAAAQTAPTDILDHEILDFINLLSRNKDFLQNTTQNVLGIDIDQEVQDIKELAQRDLKAAKDRVDRTETQLKSILLDELEPIKRLRWANHLTLEQLIQHHLGQIKIFEEFNAVLQNNKEYMLGLILEPKKHTTMNMSIDCHNALLNNILFITPSLEKALTRHKNTIEGILLEYCNKLRDKIVALEGEETVQYDVGLHNLLEAARGMERRLESLPQRLEAARARCEELHDKLLEMNGQVPEASLLVNWTLPCRIKKIRLSELNKLIQIAQIFCKHFDNWRIDYASTSNISMEEVSQIREWAEDCGGDAEVKELVSLDQIFTRQASMYILHKLKKLKENQQVSDVIEALKNARSASIHRTDLYERCFPESLQTDVAMIETLFIEVDIFIEEMRQIIDQKKQTLQLSPPYACLISKQLANDNNMLRAAEQLIEKAKHLKINVKVNKTNTV